MINETVAQVLTVQLASKRKCGRVFTEVPYDYPPGIQGEVDSSKSISLHVESKKSTLEIRVTK